MRLYPKPIQPIKYFSLFSGIGGFELGIQTAFAKRRSTCNQSDEHQVQSESCVGETYKSIQRGRCKAPHSTDDLPMLGSRSKRGRGNQQPPMCLGFSEIDKYAIQVYKTHFNHKEYGDVSAINWSNTEDFDFLVGGFPCQAFSIAGKRRGFDDTRGTLFFEIARCLREKQPRLLLLENVKGLLSHDKGQTFGVILNTLDELGYDLQWQVLNSKNFGVPQNRKRVFIVGHLRGTRRPEVFPIGEGNTDNNETHEKTRKISLTITLELSHQWGRNFQSNLPDIGRIRRLTPTECERLQSFPDGWTEGISDTQRYKCLGNAVTVNVIEAIMVRIVENL